MIKRPHFKSVIYSLEGRILMGSILLFFILLAVFAYSFATDIVLGETLLGAFIAHLFGGRAAGVGLCIAFGISLPMTILYNMFLEVLIVFFSFSMFLISINHYLNIRFLDKALRNAERNAHKYEHLISKYGLIGVFLFVLTPLPMTGPLIGSIIAYFLKFSLKKNFLTVFSGTLLAIVLWTFFFDYLSSHIEKIQWVIGIILIVVVVIFYQHIRGWFSKEDNKDVTG
jgi:uncharacterized membrane protein